MSVLIGLEGGGGGGEMWETWWSGTKEEWSKFDVWNLVWCLTWFSASTKCRTDSVSLGPVRLWTGSLSIDRRETDFFFFYKLHTAAACLSVRLHQLPDEPISSPGRTHAPPPASRNTSFFLTDGGVEAFIHAGGVFSSLRAALLRSEGHGRMV